MSRSRLAAIGALLWLALCCVSAAIGADAAEADAELEARVQHVASELRCLVCQNQTLADSNADLAQDLRREVRKLLAGGATEAQVREFMVTRYGDFVLYRPPLKATTLLLWIGPFALLLAGLWILRRIVIARRQAADSSTLTAHDAERLRALVEGTQGSDGR